MMCRCRFGVETKLMVLRTAPRLAARAAAPRGPRARVIYKKNKLRPHKMDWTGWETWDLARILEYSERRAEADRDELVYQLERWPVTPVSKTKQ